MFGANVSPYGRPGDWQVSVSSRNLVSNDHYSGTVEQRHRQELQNYVNNKQNLLDFGVSRVMTPRLSLSVGVPLVVRAEWALRDPAFPLPAPRQEIPQIGRGLGDISVTGRFWVFDPGTHADWNVATGVGLKMPTGNARYQNTFLGRIDRVERLRYVDQSVQPGDGGWGLMMEAQAFWRVRRVFLFGAGSYLANPKNTNDTPSIIRVLELPTDTGPFAGLDVNSVPDQYLARLGGTVPVWRGLAATLAWRLEGLKRYDLFGRSDGWRRPGTSMFVEPGISYASGRHTVSFNVPLAYYYNRHPNPYTGNPGDATFPRHIFLTSYSYQLGRARAATPAMDAVPPVPEPPPVPEIAPVAPPPAAASEGVLVSPAATASAPSLPLCATAASS